MANIVTLFMTKTAKKNPTLWDRTYLYNPYEGVFPLPNPGFTKHLDAIDWILFDWIWLPNPIKHNLMDLVRFGLTCAIEFDCFRNWTHTKFSVQFRSIAKLNRTQSTDWVQLSSIEFDFRTFNWLCRVWTGPFNIFQESHTLQIWSSFAPDL